MLSYTLESSAAVLAVKIVLSLGSRGGGRPQHGATCLEQFRRHGGGRCWIAGGRGGRRGVDDSCPGLARGTATFSSSLTNRDQCPSHPCACEVPISNQEPSPHRNGRGCTAGCFPHFTSQRISSGKKPKKQKHKTKNPIYLHVSALVIFF